MKIALISEESLNNEIETNVSTIQAYAKIYKDKADLICFGEAFLQGFHALSWSYQIDKNIALSINSNLVGRIKNIAKENQLAIGFGYFEHDVVLESIYCSYMIVDEAGQCIDNYRRVSIGWKEYKKTDNHYKEGQHFQIFTYKNKKITTALCGDLWYKKHIKEINKMDIDFVLWPLHIEYSLEHWQKEKELYTMQSSKIHVPCLMINNISKKAYGGCYHFENGDIKDALEMGDKGGLIIDC